MSRPFVKYGPLAGILALPGVARAATATGTANNPTAVVDISLQATLEGTITLSVKSRDTGDFTLGTSAAETVNLGQVDFDSATTPTNGTQQLFNTDTNATDFEEVAAIAPLQATAEYSGYATYTLTIKGSLTAHPYATTPPATQFDARWLCANTITANAWGNSSTFNGNNDLTAVGAPCASHAGNDSKVQVDLAFWFDQTATTGSYGALYTFTMTAQ